MLVINHTGYWKFPLFQRHKTKPDKYSAQDCKSIEERAGMTLAIQTLFLSYSFIAHKARSSLGLTPNLAPIVEKPSKREQAGRATCSIRNNYCVKCPLCLEY